MLPVPPSIDREKLENTLHQTMAMADAGEHRRAVIGMLAVAEIADQLYPEVANTALELAARSLDALGKTAQASRVRALVVPIVEPSGDRPSHR